MASKVKPSSRLVRIDDLSDEGIEKAIERMRRNGQDDDADEMEAYLAQRHIAALQPPPPSAAAIRRLGAQRQAQRDVAGFELPGTAPVAPTTPPPSREDIEEQLRVERAGPTRKLSDADLNRAFVAAEKKRQAEQDRVAREQARQNARDAKTLDQAVQANGNMSVNRRKQVVVPALEQLGYSHDDALRIALETPLNTAMYNRDAIIKSLQYAQSITPQNAAALAADSVEGAALTNPVPMPDIAARALARAQMQQGKMGGIANRARGRLGAGYGRFRSWLDPIMDRLGEAPVPTGLGGLFLLNLLFLGLVVPANAQGYPRVQLLWAALFGRAEWANLPQVPAKQAPPNSPTITAIAGIATGVEEAATSIAGVANAVENVAGGAGGDIWRGIVGGLIPGVGPIIANLPLAVTPNVAGTNAVNPAALPPAPPSQTF